MRFRMLWPFLLASCASTHSTPSLPPPRAVELPPVPPLTRPDPAQTPAPGRIERDAAVADRFTAERQSVGYDFEAAQGELSLFSLFTLGYARGWHSVSKLRIRDAQGAVLHEESRSGGAGWFGFTSFVAPRTGSYRYEIELEQGYFRYRLARYSSYRDRASGAVEALSGPGAAAGYLKSGTDCARYSLRVARGERVALKVLNAEVDARNERRRPVPERMTRVMGGGFLHPQFRIELVFQGERQPQSGHYAFWRAPRAGELVVEVRGDESADGGRFELALQRDPREIEVRGTVVDGEDSAVAGVALEFLLGADEDPVGSTVTGADGRYVATILPGPYRIRMQREGERGMRVVRATAFEPRVLDLAWIVEPPAAPDADQ